MPKYYIISGDFETAIIADTPMKAAAKAYSRALKEEKPMNLSIITAISECGNSLTDDNDLFVLTEYIFREANMIHLFTFPKEIKSEGFQEETLEEMLSLAKTDEEIKRAKRIIKELRRQIAELKKKKKDEGE